MRSEADGCYHWGVEWPIFMGLEGRGGEGAHYNLDVQVIALP